MQISALKTTIAMFKSDQMVFNASFKSDDQNIEVNLGSIEDVTFLHKIGSFGDRSLVCLENGDEIDLAENSDEPD